MNETYMKIALDRAREALDDGDFPVGCVLVASDGVLVSGRRRNSAVNNELDHAEIVALRKLAKDKPSYVDGESLTLYSTMEPCLMCFSTLILNNVRTIVYGYEDAMGGGTSLDLGGLKPLYSAMEIKVVPNVLRAECLQLFKRFFKDAGSDYWRDSLLARYTLEQK